MNTATIETKTEAEREELLAAIRNDADGRIYPRLSEELRDDREITEAAVQTNPYLYMHSSDRLRNDRDLAMVAVREYHGNYKYVSADLQESDKELAECAYAGYEKNTRYMGYRMREHIAQMQSVVTTVEPEKEVKAKEQPSLEPSEATSMELAPTVSSVTDSKPLEMATTNDNVTDNVIAKQPNPIGTEGDIHAIARARLEAERAALEETNKALLHASVTQMEAEPLANAENKWFMGQYRAYQREVMEDGFKRDLETAMNDLNDRHQMQHDAFRRAEANAHTALREAQENPSPENAEKYFRAFANERLAQAEYAPRSVSGQELEKCKSLLTSDSQNFYQSLNEWDAVRAPDTKTAIQSQVQLERIRNAESRRDVEQPQLAAPNVDELNKLSRRATGEFSAKNENVPEAKKLSELMAERNPGMQEKFSRLQESEKTLKSMGAEVKTAMINGDQKAEHDAKMRMVDAYFAHSKMTMEMVDECRMGERRFGAEMGLKGRTNEQQEAETMSSKLKESNERGYQHAVGTLQMWSKSASASGDNELRDKANGKIFELEKLHKDQTERHALRDEQERAEHRAQSRGQTNAIEQTAPGIGVKL